MTPIRAWWSRKHEFQADDFAAQYTDAVALADALVKLYRSNASTLTPDRIHSAFYDFASACAGANCAAERAGCGPGHPRPAEA